MRFIADATFGLGATSKEQNQKPIPPTTLWLPNLGLHNLLHTVRSIHSKSSEVSREHLHSRDRAGILGGRGGS